MECELFKFELGALGGGPLDFKLMYVRNGQALSDCFVQATARDINLSPGLSPWITEVDIDRHYKRVPAGNMKQWGLLARIPLTGDDQRCSEGDGITLQFDKPGQTCNW